MAQSSSTAAGPNASELDMIFNMAAESDDVVHNAPEPSKSKKKKQKLTAKLKKLAGSKEQETSPQAGPSNVSREETEQVLKAVKQELQQKHGSEAANKFTPELATEILKRFKMQDHTPEKKNISDYKFWSTQPVAKPGQDITNEEAIEQDKPLEEIRQDPYPLPEGFEWSTADLDVDSQLQEIYELLTNHYVEDSDASFRFDYSADFLKWALKPPGYVKEWHIGVRVTATKKLVGFISGIPIHLRVRNMEKHCSEINFLVVHKKLRAKRLAPVLIKEVTRRCHLQNVFQAIYTAGVYLPTPVSQCQYFHRALNVKKLVDLGFSSVPRHKTLAGMIKEATLPTELQVTNMREMELADAPAVARLIRQYMERFDMAPIFSDEEVAHNFVSGRGRGKSINGRREGQVTWSYVVEDPQTMAITDFVSFYILPSTAIKHNTTIEAAYLYYYASDVAFASGSSGHWEAEGVNTRKKLQDRLVQLAQAALTIASKASFDVFNALTLMDNSLFIHRLKFGEGDGRLNFYLYNWLARPIDGGTIKTSASALKAQASGEEASFTPSSRMLALPDQRECGSGIGVVML